MRTPTEPAAPNMAATPKRRVMTSGFQQGQDSLQSGAAARGGLYSRRCHARPDEVWAGLRIERIRELPVPSRARADTRWAQGADERAGFAAGSGGRVERSATSATLEKTARAIGQANAWDRRAQNLRRACGTTRRTWGDQGQRQRQLLQRTVWRQWAGRLWLMTGHPQVSSRPRTLWGWTPAFSRSSVTKPLARLTRRSAGRRPSRATSQPAPIQFDHGAGKAI